MNSSPKIAANSFIYTQKMCEQRELTNTVPPYTYNEYCKDCRLPKISTGTTSVICVCQEINRSKEEKQNKGWICPVCGVGIIIEYLTNSCFIPFNTPSSKNSRSNSAKGSFHSPAVRKYLQKIGIANYSSNKREVVEYKDPNRPNLFRKAIQSLGLPEERPVLIGFHPVRDSERKFDLHNAVQIIADLLQAHGFIEDDDADHLVMIPMSKEGKFYTVDKENPGMWLKILNN